MNNKVKIAIAVALFAIGIIAIGYYFFSSRTETVPEFGGAGGTPDRAVDTQPVDMPDSGGY